MSSALALYSSFLFQISGKNGTADIFRGIMVSLYVKEKENGPVQAYAPTGAMVLKRRSSLTSKLDGLPVTEEFMKEMNKRWF